MEGGREGGREGIRERGRERERGEERRERRVPPSPPPFPPLSRSQGEGKKGSLPSPFSRFQGEGREGSLHRVWRLVVSPRRGPPLLGIKVQWDSDLELNLFSMLPQTSVTPAGLEPAIPGSVGRCLIHWATGPACVQCFALTLSKKPSRLLVPGATLWLSKGRKNKQSKRTVRPCQAFARRTRSAGTM